MLSSTFKAMRAVWLLLAACAWLVWPTQGLAVTGTELIAQGRDIMRQARRDPTFIDDVLLTQSLGALNRRLRAHAPPGARDQIDPRSYAFFIADPKFNAFALPGGYIGVNTGVLAHLRTEDEFASILAHENAHVLQNHIGRLLERQDIAPWLMGAALLAAIARGGDQAATAGVVASQAYGVQSQLNFSREMESEADRIGLRMLTGAGFSGQAMVQAFALLMRAERLNDDGDFPFLRSHPLVPTRIADMQERLGASATASPELPASEPTATQTEVDSPDDFGFVRARALLLAAQQLNRTGDLAQQMPKWSLPSAAQRYAQAWIAARKSDTTLARQQLEVLRGLTLGPFARSCVALLQAELSSGEEAAKGLQAALAVDSGNLALRDAWMASLIEHGQAARASTILRDWLSQERTQPLWWKRMSEAEQNLGHEQAALGAKAELLLLQDEPEEALGVLRTAADLPATDPVDAAVIQARLKQLEQDRNPAAVSLP